MGSFFEFASVMVQGAGHALFANLNSSMEPLASSSPGSTHQLTPTDVNEERSVIWWTPFGSDRSSDPAFTKALLCHLSTRSIQFPTTKRPRSWLESPHKDAPCRQTQAS